MMADEFFTKTKCDRCGGNLNNGRTMSRFDTAYLCIRCAEAERHHPDYQKAVEAELPNSAKATTISRALDTRQKEDAMNKIEHPMSALDEAKERLKRTAGVFVEHNLIEIPAYLKKQYLCSQERELRCG